MVYIYYLSLHLHKISSKRTFKTVVFFLNQNDVRYKRNQQERFLQRNSKVKFAHYIIYNVKKQFEFLYVYLLKLIMTGNG